MTQIRFHIDELCVQCDLLRPEDRSFARVCLACTLGLRDYSEIYVGLYCGVHSVYACICVWDNVAVSPYFEHPQVLMQLKWL